MEPEQLEDIQTHRAERPRIGLILLVILLLGTVAGAVLIPNLMSRNLCSNETAAIATLRNLVSCQQQFQDRCAVDTNGNGIGEFGTFRELTGTVPVRSAAGQPGERLSPPALTPSLAGVTTEGWVDKAHYAFAIFLPREGGGWIRETGDASAGPETGDGGCDGSRNSPTGTVGVSATGVVDAALAEREWCAIAWPRMIGDRTRRIFLVTSSGETFQTDNEAGVACETILPHGPAAVLPEDWKPGDVLQHGYTSRNGAQWRRTN